MIEADFTREYHIDLSDSTMSWRRFLTLLAGLSAESLFIQTLHEEKKKKKEVITDMNDIVRDMQMQLARRK